MAYLQFTTSPAAIAYCADAADVATSLRFAQDHCLRFTVRSGGHSFAGYSTTRGLIIDVSRLNAVGVAAGGDSATIGAGAQLVDITSKLGESGLTIPGGAHPTTGAGGFFQGGGIGVLTRSAGIASDTVTSAQVVLADGRIVTASAAQNPDLFWALRGGGGGNFGVVTQFTVKPLALTFVNIATAMWTYDHAVDATDGYVRWLKDSPREINGAFRVVLDDSAAGKTPTVTATLISVGSLTTLNAELDRLVSVVGAAPIVKVATPLPYSVLLPVVYGCVVQSVPQCHLQGSTPEGQLPRIGFGLTRSRLFDGPPSRSVWDRAISLFDANRTSGQGHSLEILAMGGKAGDPARSATAFVHRDALFTADFLVQQPTVATTAEATAGKAWVDAGFRIIDAASSGETYQNFVDPSLRDWRGSYYAENYSRLVRVKRAYDPHRAFSFPQAIGS